MTREEIHNNIISSLSTNNRILLQWATGLGKSKMSIDIVKTLSQTNNTFKVLLVVAEVAHIKNWTDEILKWNGDIKMYNIVCYASLSKYVNTNWDLIIFDEAHHLGTDLRLSIIKTISSKNILLLSATLDNSIYYSIKSVYGNFRIFRITLNDAIGWNILPEPKVFLIPLELDNEYYNCSIIEEWGKKEKRIKYRCKYSEKDKYLKNRKKYTDVTLEIICTQQQKYIYLDKLFSFYREKYFNTYLDFYKNKWLQTGTLRKRFLGECKTKIVEQFLNTIKDKRFICFCSSINQAETLGSKQNTIHSKKKGSLDIINDFNNKKINSLFAVNMLQEGQNLVDIQVGIIIQLDGQERAFIQKCGRTFRAEDPVQYIFYYKGTRDEEFLKAVLNNIDEEYITSIKL